MNDQDINKLRNNDKVAWDDCVDEYAKPLFGFAFWKLNDYQTAEGVMQETFHRARKNIAGFKGNTPGQIKTFLFTIAYNLIKNEYKRRQKHKTESLDKVVSRDKDGSEISRADITPGKTSLPLESTTNKEFWSEVSNDLTPDEKEIIDLRYQSGFQLDEIAKILGKPLGTIKGTHWRILDKMRQNPTLKEYLLNTGKY